MPKMTSKSLGSAVLGWILASSPFMAHAQNQAGTSKYFVIQNVATEKTRVYERCTTGPDCAHKMVLETDTVVGRNEEGTKNDRYAYMTWLGHAKISEWVKFYQDGQGTYPRWYSPGQNPNSIPTAITDSGTLLGGSRKWMASTKSGASTVYGAFGWYAAKLTPAGEVDGVNYQWMHGTIGWGKDGSSAIDVTRGILINMFSNPGSHGCTRLENRAIAYLRHLLPAGTDIYRVYARESTREKEGNSGFFSKKVTPLYRYAENYQRPMIWNYALLTDGAAQTNGLTADTQTIMSKGVSITGANLLEQGTYEVDQYPNAVTPDYRYQPSTGKSGDRYAIDSGYAQDATSTNFRGYFLVDEGRFVNYQHPSSAATGGKIKVSGLKEFRTTVPDFLRTSGAHNPPTPMYMKDNTSSGGGGA